MIAGHLAYEERFGDIIAYGVSYGMSGKKPQKAAVRDVAGDRAYLQKVMRGEIEGKAEPVHLTPQVVETIFAKEVKNAVRIDEVTPPSTLPDEDVGADVAYLNAVSERIKKAMGN
jgi:hypothetical protein